MPEVSLSEIERLSQRALENHGAAPWVAAHVADAIARAEAVGNRICGLYYLESYCLQLNSGRVKGTVEPEVSRPRPGTVKVDAKFGFAQPAFARGLEPALAAARECGVASLAVGHAHTCTSLGYFTRQIAQAGMIGLGMTNASPIVAPPGGKTRVIGTNPFAFSVPGDDGGVAMQFDQSTTTVALGKLTTDPEAALKGSLVSMGGYKGWGLGLMVEILATGMTGGVVSRDVNPLKAPEGAPHDLGQFYLLIDPSTSSEFTGRLAQVMAGVALDEGARMPGQGKGEQDPVQLEEPVWAQLQQLAS